MKLFLQDDGELNCQRVALQTVLSSYEIYCSDKEIKKSLPKHSFGNLITELGIYLENLGIKTKLISNLATVRSTNKLFFESFEKYKLLGTFDDRKVIGTDLINSNAIVNVDWYKIKNQEVGRGAHYVVLNCEDSQLWLYDGSNYKQKVKTSLPHIINASQDVNKYHENGMWLLCLNS